MFFIQVFWENGFLAKLGKILKNAEIWSRENGTKNIITKDNIFKVKASFYVFCCPFNVFLPSEKLLSCQPRVTVTSFLFTKLSETSIR